MYFDTHAHYDDERFDPDREELLQNLPAAGIRYVLNAGTDLATSEFGLEMAHRHDHVYAAVGVHPHEADSLSFGACAQLGSLCRDPKVVAIGEIGLDYHYDFSPRAQQQHAFRMQMELAEDLDMPVIVHDREAHEDCMKIVDEFPWVRGVFHCFSGSPEMGRELLKRGWYLSFTGAITFKNARKALELLAEMPLDRIMLETDCPYLAPEPHRGKRNDSRYLPFIAAKIAEVRGMTAEEVARATTENAKRFFGIA